jgi:hypothetical protein
LGQTFLAQRRPHTGAGFTDSHLTTKKVTAQRKIGR